LSRNAGSKNFDTEIFPAKEKYNIEILFKRGYNGCNGERQLLGCAYVGLSMVARILGKQEKDVNT
jgi:hypothetical protein